MTLVSHLLFVPTLAVLSLAACTGESPCPGQSCASDSANAPDLELIRIEIEVDGDGLVFVDGPEALQCSGDQGLCSFSFARGTDLVIHADTAFAGDADWQDACVGRSHCYLTLDSDKVVVANFDDESSVQSRYASELGEDNVVVDPLPHWTRGYAGKIAVQADKVGGN